MTITELLAQLERRAAEAEAIGATAPVAGVYRAVVAELRPFANGDAPPTPAGPEHGLTAEQVAERLGVSTRWVYKHADRLGGKRLSARCVRFPESAINRKLSR